MPALSQITRPKLVTTQFGEESAMVTITFDRNKITQELFALIFESTEDPRKTCELLGGVIEEWDLVNDDGTPYPPTRDNLTALPIAVMTSLVEAVGRSAVPSDDEKKGSSAPSNIPPLVSTPPPSSSQNGPVTSSSHEPSASPSTT